MIASVFVDAFRFMPSHVSLLVDKTGQTAELAFAALGIALFLALPLGLPLLLAGLRIAAVFVIATATIAGIFGGGGLGDIMARQVTYGLGGIFAAALWVAGLALLTAAALALAQRAASRRMAPRA